MSLSLHRNIVLALVFCMLLWISFSLYGRGSCSSLPATTTTTPILLSSLVSSFFSGKSYSESDLPAKNADFSWKNQSMEKNSSSPLGKDENSMKQERRKQNDASAASIALPENSEQKKTSFVEGISTSTSASPTSLLLDPLQLLRPIFVRSIQEMKYELTLYHVKYNRFTSEEVTKFVHLLSFNTQLFGSFYRIGGELYSSHNIGVSSCLLRSHYSFEMIILGLLHNLYFESFIPIVFSALPPTSAFDTMREEMYQRFPTYNFSLRGPLATKNASSPVPTTKIDQEGDLCLVRHFVRHYVGEKLENLIWKYTLFYTSGNFHSPLFDVAIEHLEIFSQEEKDMLGLLICDEIAKNEISWVSANDARVTSTHSANLIKLAQLLIADNPAHAPLLSYVTTIQNRVDTLFLNNDEREQAEQAAKDRKIKVTPKEEKKEEATKNKEDTPTNSTTSTTTSASLYPKQFPSKDTQRYRSIENPYSSSSISFSSFLSNLNIQSQKLQLIDNTNTGRPVLVKNFRFSLWKNRSQADFLKYFDFFKEEAKAITQFCFSEEENKNKNNNNRENKRTEEEKKRERIRNWILPTPPLQTLKTE